MTDRTKGRTASFLILGVCAVLAFAPHARAAETAPAASVKTEAPAGDYILDKAHASLIFRVNHLGMSHYTARFTGLDAQLHFDPANPVASRVTATVDPRSLETDYPNPEPDFDAELQGDKWLDAGKFPQITFTSASIEPIGPNAARIHGTLALHGLTQPVTIDATFNGGYAANPMDPAGARIGFSGHGTLKRSAFGIAYGIPPAGSTMGVGDDVEFIIEAEFTKAKGETKTPEPARP